MPAATTRTTRPVVRGCTGPRVLTGPIPSRRVRDVTRNCRGDEPPRVSTPWRCARTPDHHRAPRRPVRRRPDQAVPVVRDEPISYAQLRERSVAAAASLYDLGLRRGRRRWRSSPTPILRGSTHCWVRPDRARWPSPSTPRIGGAFSPRPCARAAADWPSSRTPCSTVWPPSRPMSPSCRRSSSNAPVPILCRNPPAAVASRRQHRADDGGASAPPSARSRSGKTRSACFSRRVRPGPPRGL